MKRRLGLLATLSIISTSLSLQLAIGSGILAQGDWSLTYPSFASFATSQESTFELRASGTNEVGNNDYITLKLFTAANTQVGYVGYIHSGIPTKLVSLKLLIDKSGVSKTDLTQPLVARVEIDRSLSSKLSDANLSFSIPMTTFPRRPSDLSSYLTLNTDFSKPIDFPKSCKDLPFSYSINDPYGDIDSIDFDLLDPLGKSVASTFAFGSSNSAVTDEITLCPYSLGDGKGPYKFQIEIKFESYLNKTPLLSQFTFALSNKYSEVTNLVASMPPVCQKGSTFKVVRSSCPSGYKIASFETPSTVQWNTLSRSAGSLKGKKFLVYGCVAQFDSNTGSSKFRAYSLPEPAERYFSGVNSMYSGSAKGLLKLSEDDAFAAKVTVAGATTYTTIGGRTAVPTFSIKDFVIIGKC